MKTTLTHFSSFLILISTLLTTSVASAEETVLEEFPRTTAAVVHVDFSKIDVNGIASIFPEEAANQISSQMQPFLQLLGQSGISDLYISLDLTSLIPPKPVLVTNQGVKDESTLSQMLSAGFVNMYGPDVVFESKKVDGRAYFGTADGIARFEAADSLINLESALTSDRDHVVLLQWQKETAETLSQFWPSELTVGPGVSISPKQLAKDLKSVRLEFSLPPAESARLTIEPRDEESASAVQRQIEPVVSLVRRVTGLSIEGPKAGDPLAWELGAGQAKAVSKYLLSIRESARRTQAMNNVKQVMLAMHNHYAVYDELPREMQSEGDASLSWRVKILPFLEQQALFEAFDKEQSWDTPKNKRFSKMVVPVYSDDPTAKTRIRLPLCKGSLWESEEKLTFDRIVDGTSNTIAVVIAPEAAAVEWSKPGYLELDEQNLIGSLFGENELLIAGFFDGSVRVLSKAEMTEETLRGYLTIAGGEVIR